MIKVSPSDPERGYSLGFEVAPWRCCLCPFWNRPLAGCARVTGLMRMGPSPTVSVFLVNLSML